MNDAAFILTSQIRNIDGEVRNVGGNKLRVYVGIEGIANMDPDIFGVEETNSVRDAPDRMDAVVGRRYID